jgi:Phage portal protein, SPP1 Gp6-like
MNNVSYQQQVQTLAQSSMSHDDHMRKKCMLDAWEAYKGKFKPPLKVEKDETDDNILSNRCAPIVDKGVSFLYGEVIKIEATDETNEPDTTKQDFIKSLWGDDDDMMTLLSENALNGGVCGQMFVKLIPNKDPKKPPRIVVLNPCNIRMVTDPDDCKMIYAFITEYPMKNDIQKRQIIARVDPNGDTSTLGDTLDDTWTITNYVRKGSMPSDAWIQTGEQEIWPWPFAPILTCQNLPNPNEPYGFTDISEIIIDLNKKLNLTQSNTSRIIYYHAHPKTIATGVRLDEMKTGPGDVTILPSPDSKVWNLEMTSNLQSSRDQAMDIQAAINQESRVPPIAYGIAEITVPTSGVALKIMFQTLLEKTTTKRRLQGKLIREITRAAMVLCGKITVEEYEDYPIEIHWQNLLPADDYQEAQTAILQEQIGVSKDTLLRRQGFDPEDEKEKNEQEAADNLKAQAQGRAMPAMPQPPVPGQPPGQNVQAQQQQGMQNGQKQGMGGQQ